MRVPLNHVIWGREHPFVSPFETLVRVGRSLCVCRRLRKALKHLIRGMMTLLHTDYTTIWIFCLAKCCIAIIRETLLPMLRNCLPRSHPH